jgi:tetratricopeptide (TPR) repeat protein
MHAPEPGLIDGMDVDQLSRFDAIQLFVQSMCRLQAGFAPTRDDLVHIADICRLVQGMPLGILMAASWSNVLTPRDIAARISAQSIDFLRADWRDVPARQRSLRAVFDHSWRLLSQHEREVFAGLSVFRGGFTEEAAQRVMDATPHVLRALMDASLLVRTPGGRYEVQDLLRDYAEGKLAEDPEGPSRARDLHCEYYAEFLWQRTGDIAGGNQGEALQEMDNIRAAWQWAVARGKAAVIRRAYHSLCRLYEVQGWMEEGRAVFTQAAEALCTKEPTGETGIAYGAALYGQAKFTTELDGCASAAPLFLQSQSILRKLGARQELAQANLYLAYLDVLGDEIEAERLLKESLTIYQELGVPWGIAWTRAIQGVVARRQGAYSRAEQCFHQALGLYRDLDHLASVGMVLAMLGVTAGLQGEQAKARRYHQESLSVAQEIGFQGQAVDQLERLGDIATLCGQFGEARARYQQALAVWSDTGNYRKTVSLLDKLGSVALAQQSYADAERCLRQAVDLAADRRDTALALLVLPNVARVLGQGESGDRSTGVRRVEQAVRVAVVASQHPQATPETKRGACKLLSELDAARSMNALATAQEPESTQDLWAVVEELLVVLRGSQ